MMGKLKALASLRQNRALPPPQLEALQLSKLQAVVEAARRDVPFYRDLYARAGLPQGMPRTLADIQHLPSVSKAQMRAAGLQTVVSERPRSPYALTYHTGGTTGVPISIPLSAAEYRIRSLIDFRCLLSLGLRPWHRLVTVGPGQLRPVPLHERLGLFRTTVIHGDTHPARQVELLLKLRPDVLWCYATELQVLLFQPGHPLKSLRPKFLIASAAVLEDRVRRLAMQEWGREIFISYGCMETGRIAIECPRHEGLHVNADHLLVEILNGDRPALPGETGEVVLTALNQFSMPFIRYRLRDLAAWTGKPCSCGSTLPLIHAPEGRRDDLLRFAGGEWLSPVRFAFALRRSEHLQQYQVIQESLDWIRILIVPLPTWTTAEQDHIKQQMLAGIPAGVRLDFELVSQIEPVPGKFRMTISRLPPE